MFSDTRMEGVRSAVERTPSSLGAVRPGKAKRSVRASEKGFWTMS